MYDKTFQIGQQEYVTSDLVAHGAREVTHGALVGRAVDRVRFHGPPSTLLGVVDIKRIGFKESKRQGHFFNLSLSLNDEASSSPSAGENDNIYDTTNHEEKPNADLSIIQKFCLDFVLRSLYINWHLYAVRWIQMLSTYIQEHGYPHESLNISMNFSDGQDDDISSVRTVSTDNKMMAIDENEPFLQLLPPNILPILSFLASCLHSTAAKIKIKISVVVLTLHAGMRGNRPMFVLGFDNMVADINKDIAYLESQVEIAAFCFDNFASDDNFCGYEKVITVPMTGTETKSTPKILQVSYNQSLMLTATAESKVKSLSFIKTKVFPINMVISLTQVSAFQQYLNNNLLGFCVA